MALAACMYITLQLAEPDCPAILSLSTTQKEFMSDPCMPKPCVWQMSGDESFMRFGLLAETPPNEQPLCNLPIIGGMAGAPIPVQWHRPSAARFLLALSVVHRMVAIPTPATSPMAPQFTPAYNNLVPATQTLEDGTRCTPWESRMARAFEDEFLVKEHNSPSLTIPISTIEQALLRYMNTLF